MKSAQVIYSRIQSQGFLYFWRWGMEFSHTLANYPNVKKTRYEGDFAPWSQDQQFLSFRISYRLFLITSMHYFFNSTKKRTYLPYSREF